MTSQARSGSRSSRLVLRSLALGALGAAIATFATVQACSDDQVYDTTETPTTAGQVLGPDGGSITATDGTTLLVPAGALTSEVTITIAANPVAPLLENATALATAHIFGPEGQTFSKPVTVTLAFDPTLLPTGAKATDVQIYTAPLASNDYQIIPTAESDASHVTGQTTHFSNFIPGVPLDFADAGAHDAAAEAGAADGSLEAGLDASDAADGE